MAMGNLAQSLRLLPIWLGALTSAAILLPQTETPHLSRQVGGSNFIPVDDRFTPHQPPTIWYALGDSYTAGPGTGDDYDANLDCARNNGSYAVQTENEFPFKTSNDMNFIACSGQKSPDTLQTATTAIQQDKADFMVMTVGGNDIGFADIVVECLIKADFLPGDCDETIQKGRQVLGSQKFEDDIHAVYDKIFEKMLDDRHHQLYHIIYNRFFNDQTELCNDMSFSVVVPKLTRQLRRKLNALADDLNQRLEEIANSYIQKQTKASWSQGPRLFVLNPDKQKRSNGDTYGLFDGHRFCEPRKTDLKDPSVWFFGTLDKDSLEKRDIRAETLKQYDTSNCDTDPKYETDVKFNFECDLAQYSASQGGAEQEELIALPEIVSQSFHPRTAGFRAEKRMLQESLQKNRPAER